MRLSVLSAEPNVSNKLNEMISPGCEFHAPAFFAYERCSLCLFLLFLLLPKIKATHPLPDLARAMIPWR